MKRKTRPRQSLKILNHGKLKERVDKMPSYGGDCIVNDEDMLLPVDTVPLLLVAHTTV